MADDKPSLNACGVADLREVGDGLAQVVSPAGRPSDATQVGKPRADARSSEVIGCDVVDAPWPARQEQCVGPTPSHPNMELRCVVDKDGQCARRRVILTVCPLQPPTRRGLGRDLLYSVRPVNGPPLWRLGRRCDRPSARYRVQLRRSFVPNHRTGEAPPMRPQDGVSRERSSEDLLRSCWRLGVTVKKSS